ncbi:MAG: hypothetical protein ACSHYA_17460 [Opitutaceae bacterium]
MHIRLYFFALALMCPSLIFAAKLSSVEGDYFEVVGVDYRSVAFVSELSEHIATECNRFLPDNGVAFPQHILIALRPEESVNFEGSTSLSLGDQGTVRLDFRWTEAISLEQTCYAITQAFLTRYAIYQNGPTAPSKIKAWAVHALALEALYSIRPTLLIAQLNESRGTETIESSVLLTEVLSADVDDSFGHDAYFFLSALKKALFDRKVLRSIIENAISGGNPSEGISKLVLSDLKPEETLTFGLWWQAQRAELVSEKLELFEMMTESREWIEEMTDFTQFAEGNGDYKNLRSLWKLRGDEGLRSILKARLGLIRLRIEIVNPVYFNSARSLGSLYELLLDEDGVSHQFMHILLGYLGDFEDAKKIEETTLDLLYEK